MAPRVDPVATDETLPAQADVVIIGGGIIGTSAALFLAERGVSTVLCEKGHIAGEQSSRNWGWCRKMARDPREIPLVIESLRLWQGMNERVEAETGFRTCGIMYLAESQDDLARLEGWLEHARDYQLDTRVIDGAEVARLLPGSAKSWAGALYTPSDGKAEPQMAAPAIAAAARRHGATVLAGCAPCAASRPPPDGSPAVVTEKGPHRLPVGRAGGRRVVAAVLRQSRHRPAAAEGAGFGHAHRAARWRARDLGIGRAVRLPQADGRRLHGRDARRAHDRPGPGQLPAAAGIPAEHPPALEEAAPANRPAFRRGVANAAALEPGSALAVRSGAGARPGRRSGRARSRPRQHRRGISRFPQCRRSRKAGAA